LNKTAFLPYLLFQIDDGEPSLVARASYIERKDDDTFTFETELTREANRALCNAVHACGTTGTFWTVQADRPDGETYDGEITAVEMISPPCCTDSELTVHITFKLLDGDGDDDD
jgi:hypothetical protein